MKRVYLAIPELMNLEDRQVWGSSGGTGATAVAVQCVKAYRQASGQGLSESKDAINKIIKNGGFIKEKAIGAGLVRAFKLTLNEYGIRWVKADRFEVMALQVHEA